MYMPIAVKGVISLTTWNHSYPEHRLQEAWLYLLAQSLHLIASDSKAPGWAHLCGVIDTIDQVEWFTNPQVVRFKIDFAIEKAAQGASQDGASNDMADKGALLQAIASIHTSVSQRIEVNRGRYFEAFQGKQYVDGLFLSSIRFKYYTSLTIRFASCLKQVLERLANPDPSLRTTTWADSVIWARSILRDMTTPDEYYAEIEELVDMFWQSRREAAGEEDSSASYNNQRFEVSQSARMLPQKISIMRCFLQAEMDSLQINEVLM